MLQAAVRGAEARTPCSSSADGGHVTRFERRREFNGAMDNRQHLFIGRARTDDAVFEWISQLLKLTVPPPM